ncbi:LOW QUALITY PROTEIN: peripheral-type benzodiazepine receptor-associated protein 1-like [Rhipicephalus sanguineus]|uniref:LOW QUALITY PROTEIN: peripheral-type benzodiazepine receptor-associated protein 1-like n=1 Tax=Rhipicephalus sanguineus TaxID=34632 RepID=UPI0020C266AD|nr:LOW QUALITY PROTEIN: peripheral-type benzodiazepine receptor-associated protein 1-like [Rhipicephalus sanguineus]
MVGLLVRAGPKPIVEPFEAVFCPSISDKLTACGRRRQMGGGGWADMEAAERRTVGSELRPPSSRLSGAEHRARAPSISHLQRSQSLIPQRRPSRTARERIVTNCLLYQNVGELQHMIKQSAKERLQLERQVAHLHQAIRLQKERIEHEYRLRLRDVEDRLKEQESQLTQLQKDLDDRCEISADLERQLLEALEQKIEVEAQNATLEEEVTRLRTAETELRVRSAELEAARGEASALEALVGHLRQAADQRRLLERQHAQALQEVRAAKAAAAAAKGSAEAAHLLTIQTLESRVRELQKKCELQNVLHEELVLEMAALRRQQMQQQRTRSARESWRAGRSLSAEVVPSDRGRPHEPADFRPPPAGGRALVQLESKGREQRRREVGLSPDGRHHHRDHHTSSSSRPFLDMARSAGTDALSQLAAAAAASASGGAAGTPSLTCSSVLTVYFQRDPRRITFSECKQSAELSVTRASPATTSTTREVDRILARIQQDNRVLAELEKSRATIGSPVSVANLERLRQNIEAGEAASYGMTTTGADSLSASVAALLLQSQLKSSFSSPAIDQLSIEPHRTSQLCSQLRPRALQRSTVTMQELDGLMAKLEQDNRILAELDKKRSCLGSSCGLLPSRLCGPSTSAALSTSLSSTLSLSGGGTAVTSLAPVAASRSSLAHRNASLTLPSLPPNGIVHSAAVSTAIQQQQQQLQQQQLQLQHLLQQQQSQPPVTPTPRLHIDAQTAQALAVASSQQHNQQPLATPPQQQLSAQHQHQQQVEEDPLGVDSVEFLDLPGRGRCRVYVARYSYDPLKQSPNEHPEAELFLSAGDYILIFGEMDEDGFFNGELLDGRKGLVPSNFVEKLTGEDLLEFQTSILYGNRDSDDSSASVSYAPDLDNLAGSDEQHRLPPEDFHRMNDYIDLEDIEEVDEDALSETERENDGTGGAAGFPVPPPQRLVLERQLNKSVLIGWLPPDVVLGSLEAYHVYVDGVLKATVRSGHRTRALLEGVDAAQPHRISVRSVLTSGQHSRDAACTIVIGKNVPLAPSCVKASNITSTTATISWLPSNSNFSHVVAVNSVEMKSLKPGTFRHLVTGLAPNTSYRVSVRAKPGRLLMSSAAAALTGASASADEHAKGAEPRKLASLLTSFVDFRTLPKGIPDPPVDVQVEAGPQEGTVLVTWLPVTINALGTSNGAAVTGYAVYAAGKKVTEIDSPTGDHALLDVASLLPLHTRAITVRTRAGDSLSVDSLPVVVPDEFVHPTRTSKSAERVEENHSELSDIVEELEDEMMENGELGHRGARGSRGVQGPGGRKHHHHHHHHHHQQPQQQQQNMQQQQQPVMHHTQPQHHQMHQMHQPGGHPQYQQPGNMHQPAPQQPPVAQRRQMAQQPMHQGVGGVHHHGVRRSEKRNSAGQLIIEPEDALSDKEIYPYYGPSGMPMDMAKDSEGGGLGVVDNYSEEEFAKYDMGPRGGAPRPAARHQVPGRYHGGGGGGPRGGVDQHGGGGMAYQERPRPTSPTPPSRAMRPLVDDEPPPARGTYWSPVGNRAWQRRPAQPRVRWFVALFDYDPQTMSPNPDTADEELPFQEGDLIKIYGGKDQDGFYKGECNGRIGFVPCNMVSEVHMDNETNEPPRSRPAQHRGNDSWGGVMRPQPKRMVALYDYDPAELSPNPDPFSELAFSTGDVIYVYGDMDEDGFFFGELRGQQGLVPSNFLTEAPPDYATNDGSGQRGPSRHGSLQQQHKASLTNRTSESPTSVMTFGASPPWEAADPEAEAAASTRLKESTEVAEAAPRGRTRRPLRTRLLDRRAATGRHRRTTGRRSSSNTTTTSSNSSTSSSTSNNTPTSSRTSSGGPRQARAGARSSRPTTSTGHRTSSAPPRTRRGRSWAQRSDGETLLLPARRRACLQTRQLKRRRAVTPPRRSSTPVVANGKQSPVPATPVAESPVPPPALPQPRPKKKGRFRFLHALKRLFGMKGKRGAAPPPVP